MIIPKMEIKLTSAQLSMISAGLLIVGGVVLSLTNYQNIFAPTLIIAGLICLRLSQNRPRPKLLTIGISFSISGILFVACIDLFPIFSNIRNSDLALQSPSYPVYFYTGVLIFFAMIFMLMSGFMIAGIAILRSSSLPKASGVFFILTGMVAFAANVDGVMLTLSGLIWFREVLRQKKASERWKYLQSLDD